MTDLAQTLPQRIRSFIRRQGRLTPGQEVALDQHWSQYGLEPELDYDFSQVFGRQAPLIVEIGFGNGDSLAKMAAANPDHDYIGIEVHKPGVGHLLILLHEQGLTNVRVYCHDAIEILEKEFFGGKVIMHCFSAKKSLIKRGVDNGWYFSVPPIITRLLHFQTLVEMVPLTQILTETDSPYLSPVAGTRNEPANVSVTISEAGKFGLTATVFIVIVSVFPVTMNGAAYKIAVFEVVGSEPSVV